MEAATTVTSRLTYKHCAKCFNRIVLHAFSESHCLEISNVHTPFCRIIHSPYIDPTLKLE